MAGADLSYQILIVDDDIDVINLFHKFLKCENYKIKLANNMHEALMILDEFDLSKPITAVIDFILKEDERGIQYATGIDLVVEILQRNIKCNNILVTGSSLATEYVEMFRKQSQCEDTAALFPIQLIKPISQQELREAVFKSINRNYKNVLQ